MAWTAEKAAARAAPASGTADCCTKADGAPERNWLSTVVSMRKSGSVPAGRVPMRPMLCDASSSMRRAVLRRSIDELPVGSDPKWFRAPLIRSAKFNWPPG